MNFLRSISLAVAAIFFALGLSSGSLFADSLVLRNGEHVRGKFAGGTEGVIAFVTDRGTVYYDVSEILAMTFEPAQSGSSENGAVAPKLPSSGASLEPESNVRPRRHLHLRVRISEHSNPQVHKPGRSG